MVQYGAGVVWTHTREALQSYSSTRPIRTREADHLVDQVSKACLFLHENCKLVRADTNRENLMLRYPGRESAYMPDVVLIDWSLWKEASEEIIVRDTESLYECLFPVLFEGGWRCRVGQGEHDRDRCTAHNDSPHSYEWLDLCKTVGAKQKSLRDLGNDVSEIAKKSRQEVEGDNKKAIEFQALVGSTEVSFIGERLRKALIAAENKQEAKQREGGDLE